MKEISEDFQSFLTKDTENNAKKITEKIIEKMSTKFDELSIRIETIDKKEEAAESLVKQNQNNFSNLTSESAALQEKIEEAKKIHELEENIEDQINRNSRDTLVIRDIEKGNQEKTWNNTSYDLSCSLCGLFRQNPNQFFSDIVSYLCEVCFIESFRQYQIASSEQIYRSRQTNISTS